MSFLYPQFLYFLLPPMIILFLLLLTKKDPQVHFFSDEIAKKLRVSANMLTLKARNALFFLTGLLIVVALAQPVIKDGVVKVKAKSSDIMIALDISDSMLAHDLYPSRLELAKNKALTLLKDVPNERMGVVAFAKNSYLVSPLSFDSTAVAFLLSKLDTSFITQKGTDFLSMLKVVANSSEKDEKRYLLIFSDGGDKDDFSKEISYAKENNIVVFILGVGTKKGAPVKQEDGTYIKYKGDIIVSKLNENISKFATKTGGVYIQSTTSDKDIKAMYKEIQRVSDKKELKSQEIEKYKPLFYYPLGLALLILLLALSSINKRTKIDKLNVFLVFLLVGAASADLKAGLFDFRELDKAEGAYKAGEYDKSAKIYEKYADEHKSGQSYYNAANSYYKQKDYKKALELYQKAVFDDEKQRSKNYANIGNSYVKTKEPDSLAKAKEFYEKSLEIKEDKEVRENLEAVKKELERQKQQKQQNKQNDQKKNNDQKKQDKDSKQNKDNKQDQKNDTQDSDKEKSDEKKKEKEQDKKDKEKDSKQKNEDNNESKNKQQEMEKEDKKESEPEDIKQQNAQIKEMSDAELEKWINKLQNKQKTYLYKLNKSENREDEDEKPW